MTKRKGHALTTLIDTVGIPGVVITRDVIANVIVTVYVMRGPVGYALYGGGENLGRVMTDVTIIATAPHAPGPRDTDVRWIPVSVRC